MKCPKPVFGILVLCMFLSSSFAEKFNSNNLFRDYDYVLYDATKGFERSRINDIMIDANNFLWLATERGVILYDRKNFIEIGLNDHDLEKSECRYLRSTADRLYAVFPGKGFAVVNLKDYSDIYHEKCDVSDLAPLGEQEYAVLFSNGTIEKRNNTKKISSTRIVSKKTGLLILFNQELFVSIPDRAIFRLNKSSLNIIDSSDFSPTGYLSSFYPAGEKLMFFDNHSYRGWDGIKWLKRPQWFNLKGTESVTRAVSDIAGNFIFSRFNRNLVVLVADGQEKVLQADPISNFEYYSLNMSGNKIFAGTNQGLLVFSPKPEPHRIINDNITDNKEHVRIRRKILELGNDKLLLSGFPYSYIRTKDEFKRLCEKRFSVIDAVLISDTLFLATEGSGLMTVSYSSGIASNIIIKDHLDALGFYSSLLHDEARHLLVIGGIGKVVTLELTSRKSQRFDLPNPGATVRCLLQMPDNSNWLIGTNAGLFLADKNFVSFKLLGLPDGIKGNLISDLLYDAIDHSVYIAHDKGVTVLDARSLKVKKDLPEDAFDNPRCVSLIKDVSGRIWIGTYSGLVCYSPSDGSYIRLTRKTGLVNSEYNFKSAARLSNGQLVFGGLNCYDIINPSAYTRIYKFEKGIITGCHLFSEKDTLFLGPVGTQKKIRFNIDEELLRIYLSSYGSNAESNNRFEYSIDNGSWRATGNEPYLDIFLLDPGSYELNFRSFDRYGNIIGYPVLQVKAMVPFYKSSWFIWSIVGVALFGLLMYSTSYSRYNNRVVALRDKIAMDLHDEVGSILTYSLYQTKIKDPSQIKSVLQHNLREAIYALRVYVKSIDQKPRGFLEMIDGVRDFLTSTFPSCAYEVELKETHDTDRTINAELYRDIKLCIFELCTNILKHSDARKIGLTIEKAKDTIRVIIQDDGMARGDAGEYGSGGSGSKNINKRAARYGGQATFTSGGDSKGFRADITFNI